jgi:hypothetical protein
MNLKRVAAAAVGAAILSVGAFGSSVAFGKFKPGGSGGSPNGSSGGAHFPNNSGGSSGGSGQGTLGGLGGGSLD